MKTHYHVFCAMPGYLPDNEPETFTNRRDAEAHAKWYADCYREYDQSDPDHRIRITGSARKGWYVVGRGEFALPIYITIDPCTDATCEIEESYP